LFFFESLYFYLYLVNVWLSIILLTVSTANFTRFWVIIVPARLNSRSTAAVPSQNLWQLMRKTLHTAMSNRIKSLTESPSDRMERDQFFKMCKRSRTETELFPSLIQQCRTCTLNSNSNSNSNMLLPNFIFYI